MRTITGVHASGGTLTTVTPQTSIGCITHCIGTTACIAVDWESSTSTCWVHGDLTCGVLYLRSSSTHYRVKSCGKYTI